MKNVEKEFQTEAKKNINFYNEKKYEIVINRCILLLNKFPKSSFLYNLIGMSYKEMKNSVEAKKNFLISIDLDPKNLAAITNLANLYRLLKKFITAEKYFKEVLFVNPNYVTALLNYGNLKADLDKNDEALNLYKKASQLDKNNIIIHYNLGLMYQSLGDFNNSKKYFEKTLKINKKFTTADKLISTSTDYNLNKDHLLSMENKINNLSLRDDQKIDLYFAISKAYESLSNYKNSYYNFEKGNKIKKKLVKYDFQKDKAQFDAIQEGFKNINLDKETSRHFYDQKIIFIVGLPRSGTSLIEQIISSHSNVYGAGELSFLDDIIKKKEFKNYNFTNNLNSFNEIKSIANDYYNLIKNFNINEKNITDKAPLNFRWIGFIKLLFPNAKVIHCMRNAEDNLLSLYKNVFDENLNWVYDQKNLIDFYNNYLNLMNFWEKTLPNYIYNIKYEKLIQNQDAEIKNLINFCGLSWEDNCLKSHNNKKTIKTVSSFQARKPIYNKSVNISEKYKPYLKDFFSKI